MNIYLIGFMGSGKSSLGRKMANSLNRNFIDLDEEIERRSGMTIPDLFGEKGEAHFRQLETDVLKSLSPELDLVVSTGGGAPCSDVNWEVISLTGMSIYLKESADILFGRLRQHKGDRPLIEGMGDGELRAFIEKTLIAREAYYNKADFIYEKEKTSWKFLIDQIDAYMR